MVWTVSLGHWFGQLGWVNGLDSLDGSMVWTAWMGQWFGKLD